MRNKRRAAHAAVPLGLKEAQEGPADVVAAPEVSFCIVPRHLFRALLGHVSPSFAGFDPQIIADAATPRNERKVAKWRSFECHPVTNRLTHCARMRSRMRFPPSRTSKLKFRQSGGGHDLSVFQNDGLRR